MEQQSCSITLANPSSSATLRPRCFGTSSGAPVGWLKRPRTARELRRRTEAAVSAARAAAFSLVRASTSCITSLFHCTSLSHWYCYSSRSGRTNETCSGKQLSSTTFSGTTRAIKTRHMLVRVRLSTLCLAIER